MVLTMGLAAFHPRGNFASNFCNFITRDTSRLIGGAKIVTMAVVRPSRSVHCFQHTHTNTHTVPHAPSQIVAGTPMVGWWTYCAIEILRTNEVSMSAAQHEVLLPLYISGGCIAVLSVLIWMVALNDSPWMWCTLLFCCEENGSCPTSCTRNCLRWTSACCQQSFCCHVDRAEYERIYE